MTNFAQAALLLSKQKFGNSKQFYIFIYSRGAARDRLGDQAIQIVCGDDITEIPWESSCRAGV